MFGLFCRLFFSSVKTRAFSRAEMIEDAVGFVLLIQAGKIKK